MANAASPNRSNSMNTGSGNSGATPLNTNLGSTSTGGSLKEQITSASERFSDSEIGSRARDAWDDATEMASEFYGRASTWLGADKSRMVAGAFVLVAAAGVIGYFVGRGSRYPMPELREL